MADVFARKGREARKPLPVVVADREQIERLGGRIDDPRLEALMRLWPAPLSLLVPLDRPLAAAPGVASLAVRIPAHAGLRRLLAELGGGLTATSANRSGELRYSIRCSSRLCSPAPTPPSSTTAGCPAVRRRPWSSSGPRGYEFCGREGILCTASRKPFADDCPRARQPRPARHCRRRSAACGRAGRDAVVNQVRRGQTGYGLSVFSGSAPERFDVEVLGVLPQHEPRYELHSGWSGHGLEESGVIAGMSGSPVWIVDGRLVGAVAFAWPFSHEAIAGVTPIGAMRRDRDRPCPGAERGGRRREPRSPRSLAARAARGPARPRPLVRRFARRRRRPQGRPARCSGCAAGFAAADARAPRCGAAVPRRRPAPAAAAPWPSTTTSNRASAGRRRCWIDGDLRAGGHRHGDRPRRRRGPRLRPSVPRVSARSSCRWRRPRSSPCCRADQLVQALPTSARWSARSSATARRGSRRPARRSRRRWCRSPCGRRRRSRRSSICGSAEVPTMSPMLVAIGTLGALDARLRCAAAIEGLDLRAALRPRRARLARARSELRRASAGSRRRSISWRSPTSWCATVLAQVDLERHRRRARASLPEPRTARARRRCTPSAREVAPGTASGSSSSCVAYRGEPIRRALELQRSPTICPRALHAPGRRRRDADAARLPIEPASPVTLRAGARRLLRSFHSAARARGSRSLRRAAGLAVARRRPAAAARDRCARSGAPAGAGRARFRSRWRSRRRRSSARAAARGRRTDRPRGASAEPTGSASRLRCRTERERRRRAGEPSERRRRVGRPPQRPREESDERESRRRSRLVARSRWRPWRRVDRAARREVSFFRRQTPPTSSPVPSTGSASTPSAALAARRRGRSGWSASTSRSSSVAAAHPDGWVVGTGNDGRVLLVDRAAERSRRSSTPPSRRSSRSGSTPTAPSSPASSPGGKVYRLADGQAEELLRLPERPTSGRSRAAPTARLLVGDRHRGPALSRSTPPARARCSSTATTPTCGRSQPLPTDGDLLIGTAGEGLILRWSAPTAPCVTLYDAAQPEVVGVRRRRRTAAAYAAVLASEASCRRPRAAPATAAGDSENGEAPTRNRRATIEPEVASSIVERRLGGSRPPSSRIRRSRSEILRISPERSGRDALRSFEDETVYSPALARRPPVGRDRPRGQALQPAGRPPAGAREGRRRAPGRGPAAGRAAAGPSLTTNAAALYRFADGTGAAAARYTSPVLDAGQVARFGTLRWCGRGAAPGARSRFSFRSGMSAEPDAPGRPWSGAARRRESRSTRCRDGPLSPVAGGARAPATETLADASPASSSPTGRRTCGPQIDALAVLEPGQVLVPAELQPGAAGLRAGASQPRRHLHHPRAACPTATRPAQDAVEARATGRCAGPAERPQRRRAALRPRRSAPDRRAPRWLEIARGSRRDHYSFDATVLPDGVYRFRLTASDRRRQRPDEALDRRARSASRWWSTTRRRR